MCFISPFSGRDLRYLRAEYRTLDELCADRPVSPQAVRQAIGSSQMPRATYVLPAGTELFTADFFRLSDEAGGPERVRDHFFVRHRNAVQSSGAKGISCDQDWAHYLSGLYGVCLKEVTPEAMVWKSQLVASIESITSQPIPNDPSWVVALRSAVDALDALERPFTDYDRVRWGVTSRDTHIVAVRDQYLDGHAAIA